MKAIRILFLLLPFVIGFALIRFYENTLFYDPFLNYFKGNYQENPFPDFESFRLFLNYFFRYVLNTLLSLGIIYVIFRNKEFIKVSSILYLLFFVVLILALFAVVNYSENAFSLFYIRKFLIQPLFLLLFLLGFYFQMKSKK